MAQAPVGTPPLVGRPRDADKIRTVVAPSLVSSSRRAYTEMVAARCIWSLRSTQTVLRLTNLVG